MTDKITVKQAAEMCGAHTIRIYQAIYADNIEAAYEGGRIFLSKAEVEKWRDDPSKHRDIPTPDGYYTVKEIAEMTNYSYSNIQKYISIGAMKSRKIGRRKFVKAEEVERWILEMKRMGALL